MSISRIWDNKQYILVRDSVIRCRSKRYYCVAISLFACFITTIIVEFEVATVFEAIYVTFVLYSF